jgi:putative transposase
MVDTLGLILALVVWPANRSDQAGGNRLLELLGKRFPRLLRIWADSAYQGLVAWAWALGGWLLEIVKGPEKQTRFELEPHRWIVERTFAWWENYHRLNREYEGLPESSESLIYAAMIHLMLKRLAPRQ